MRNLKRVARRSIFVPHFMHQIIRRLIFALNSYIGYFSERAAREINSTVIRASARAKVRVTYPLNSCKDIRSVHFAGT